MIYEHNEHDQHELICEIFQQMADERNKSAGKMKNLFFIKQNNAVMRKFWEILDQKLPNHTFTGIGCCIDCGKFYLD